MTCLPVTFTELVCDLLKYPLFHNFIFILARTAASEQGIRSASVFVKYRKGGYGQKLDLRMHVAAFPQIIQIQYYCGSGFVLCKSGCSCFKNTPNVVFSTPRLRAGLFLPRRQ